MNTRMTELTSDWELLREYADTGSDDAFAQLVARHVDMVYAACRRQAKDAHLAEDATQAVFIILARKAKRMHAGVVLGAWLYRTACYAALNAFRVERRRKIHERKAATMAAPSTRIKPDPAWFGVEPLLDEAVAALGERDRAAIVLRYMEHRSVKEVGDAMGTTEDAASMRITRALAKLRSFFHRRGITLTAVVLGNLLWAESSPAAPAGVKELAVEAPHAVAAASAGELAREAMRVMARARMRSSLLIGAGIVIGLVLLYLLAEAALQPRPQRPMGGPPPVHSELLSGKEPPWTA